ncbi:unnamed protein product [Rhizophagus irregularis]|nr:unnamed protein product [Rhizophagus irregularis]
MAFICIGFALDQLVSASRLWIFQIGYRLRTLDFNRLHVFGFNRYQFDSFGFELVSALGLGFWIGIGFGSLDLIGISSGSVGFWISWLHVFGYFRSDFGFWIGIGFGSLDLISIGFEYLDFGSVSTSDPWFYILNRLISFEYWMDDFFNIGWIVY